jgi:hypothetical protein
VWVGDQELINTWTIHGKMENSGSITLTAGQKYPIRVEYYNSTSTAQLSLLWTSPGNTQPVAIPSSQFATTINTSSVASTLINEPFDSGASAGNFVTSGGTWTVAKGVYTLTNPASGSSTVGNASQAIHKQTYSGDFQLSTGAAAATSGNYDDFSIIFDYKDTNNYYYASFNETNDANTNGLFKVVGGVQTQLADFATTTAPGQMVSVGISRTGKTISITQDGAAIATVTDSTFNSGKVGFGARNNGATFDTLVLIGTASTIANPGTPPAPVPSTPAPVPPAPTPPTPVVTVPPTTGWPTATNTGVPSGTKLTASGSVTITQDNTVINALDVDGGIKVSAKNVTIKNSRVRTSSDKYTLHLTPGASVTITDSEFGRTDSYKTAASYPSVYPEYDTSLTIIRSNFYGGADIFKVDSNFTLRDSYVHDPYHAAGMHSDLMQIKYSSSAKNFANISVVHNTLLAKSPTTGDNVNAVLIRSSANEYVTNLLFDNNYINGGNYSIFCPADSRNKNAVFRNNQFGHDAKYGIKTDCGAPYIQWDNTNIFSDTKKPT